MGASTFPTGPENGREGGRGQQRIPSGAGDSPARFSARFSPGHRERLWKKGDRDMATREQFATQLHALIKRFAQEGVDPIDLANELQDQVNVFIGQHNPEYELYRPTRG
jgi:hypothetical protein